LLQLVALLVFMKTLRPAWRETTKIFSPASRILLMVVLLSLLLKFALQTLSAIPPLIDFVTQVRFFVLAYLHLVLIGGISFFIIAWTREEKLTNGPNWSFWLVTGSFVGTEISMVGAPLLGSWFSIATLTLFIFSVLLWVGLALAIRPSPSR
jgi:hypothetical protein